MNDQRMIDLNFTQDRKLLAEAIRAGNRSLKLSTGRPVLDIALNLLTGLVIATGCMAVIQVIIIALNVRYSGNIALIYIALIVFCAYVYYFRRLRKVQRRLFESRVYDGDMRIVLSPDEVSVETAMMRNIIKWSAIDAVIFLRPGLGLRIGCSVIPIPRHAIPAELGENGLADWIKARRKGAGQ